MAEPLRPLSTGELLDSTFTLYRRNFKLFIGVSVIGPIAGLIYQLLTIGGTVADGKSTSPAFGASMLLGMGVGLVLMLAGSAISQAATVKAVAAVYVGQGIGIGEAYRVLRGRFWRIIGIFFSVSIRVGGAMLLAIILVSVLAVALTALGTTLGTAGTVVGAIVGVICIVAAILLAIWVFVRYAVAVQACVVEDLPGKQALKRSAFLTKGDRNRVTTVYGVFVVIGWVLGAAIGGFTLFLAPRAGVVTSQIISAVATLIAGTLVAPLGTIGMSLLYYDERVRKEAFDLELMMQSLAPLPPPATPDSAVAPEPVIPAEAIVAPDMVVTPEPPPEAPSPIVEPPPPIPGTERG